jgi:predicted nucleic-acid-binding Zn-ribbon protein
MKGGSIGDIPLRGIDPYSEEVELSQSYTSNSGSTCPLCGSPHHTSYNKVMTIGNKEGVLSGDLSIRKLVIKKCLSCGHTAPVKFMMVREM